ncbi:MAG: hypothetical protein A2138_00400 [Deltaproteobacteria bacterium RBG_16_71_12]|nr:MAG: hypothetical protein A2138_00400 [Deltaproteobacteria bacterium RBG_16_71_12]
MRTAASALACLAALPLALACEPEIGGICDPDTEFVDQLVEQVAGTNNLVLDVRLDNCTQGFCLSTDGSRPYCTKRCEADAECTAEAGAGFACQEVVAFGPLACDDYEDPNEPRDGSTGGACAGGTGCSGEEICFEAPSEHADTCGIPGRDCLTGDGGAQSTQTFTYCAASSVSVIEERDVQFGRTTE